ncbi:MAG: ABC transporter substrate-binding protein [Burkholderiaceae bacterium]|nr:ABC transporter substrate-binding protein [Burkholderiaceae bacterium]
MTKPTIQLLPEQRRAVLQRILAVTAAAMLPAIPVRAQPARPWVIAQIVDTSAQQQDVSKDYLIGSRAAWQEINAQGGLLGRPVKHLSIETDGSATGLRAALDNAQGNTSCIALSGTAGDRTAQALTSLLRADRSGLAHVAPWLQNASSELDDTTFAIFADRQAQIAHIVKSLSIVGTKDLGVIYASPQEYALYRADVERSAQRMSLQLSTSLPEQDLKSVGQKLGASSPAVQLFIGGTPELAQFTRGLEQQARQRYVLALADVNLQTMKDMGAARQTPVFAAQTVPMVNSSLPVVRAYRAAMSKFFDEPPTPLSLAGYIAARYTFEVLSKVGGGLNRQTALAAFQKRESVDVGGFRVNYNATQRGSVFVTQSMLSRDGYTVG